MSTARLWLAVAGKQANGKAPFFSEPWGTSRFSAPLHAHGTTGVAA